MDNRHIVLVDDVLQTGRTIRAALNVLFDYGRPASVLLATLAERDGRELPIEPNVVGLHARLRPGVRRGGEEDRREEDGGASHEYNIPCQAQAVTAWVTTRHVSGGDDVCLEMRMYSPHWMLCRPYWEHNPRPG